MFLENAQSVADAWRDPRGDLRGWLSPRSPENGGFASTTRPVLQDVARRCGDETTALGGNSRSSEGFARAVHVRLTAEKPFSVDLGRLRSRDTDRSAAAVERANRAGEEPGLVDRAPVRRRGRKPHVAEEITAEPRRRGVQLEEALALYKGRENGPAG